MISPLLKGAIPIAALIASLLAGPLAAEPPSAEELLQSSIDYHDPGHDWQAGAYRLMLRQTRPDGPDRETTLEIDNARGHFTVDQARDGDRIEGELHTKGCIWKLNGSADFSAEDEERLRLTCARLERMRDYHTYLWGLPMKLRDPGTRIDDEVREREFRGSSAWEIRVTYDEEVGSDVWYFYFDPESRALIGYRFYHDESANDGEYITLEDETAGAGLKLPANRAWYMHQADEFLGTDHLVSIELLEATP